jgi:hypothetical protein
MDQQVQRNGPAGPACWGCRPTELESVDTEGEITAKLQGRGGGIGERYCRVLVKEAGCMWVNDEEKKNTFFGKEENRKYLEFLKAVQEDYNTNFHKIDRRARKLYNKPAWKVEHYVPLMRQGFGPAQVKALLGSRGLDTQIEGDDQQAHHNRGTRRR